MNAGDLIKLLQTYPEDFRVVVQGYEDGFDDVTAINEITIQPASNPQWYYGKYEKTYAKETVTGEKAVLVLGKVRAGE